ncbi:PsiF family protein [Dyella silvatica]|uniref:PsiF family protein n=1 Tax=Dyella silvatica TaxID=2992128 RepID=UPI00225342BD|nr:PsiF family protein [Dyella silvatica]
MSMRFSLIAVSAMLAFAATTAFASPQAASTAAPAATKTMSSSQQRMGECNKQAAGHKGADHKAVMSACMKGESPAAPAAADATAAKQTPQERMKSCNADAKTKALAGDARKTFMSNCLKASPATP